MKRNIIAGFVVILFAGLVFADNELQVSTGATYSKNNRTRTIAQKTAYFNVSGNGSVDNVQIITTATLGTALNLGGVTVPGFSQLHNMGPTLINTNGAQTNFIEVGYLDIGSGYTNFVVATRLDTNQISQIWLPTNAPYARAIGTNSIYLDYSITDR
jgi:hypothetical protein